MVNIFQLSMLFIIGGFIGWVIETINKSVKQKQFVNSGFLKGPYLPVYGLGAIIIYIVASLKVSFFIKLILFLIGTVLLELGTGIFLEKGFHLKLWNYHECVLNYNGIISLRHSFFWLLLSVAFYFIIFPYLPNLFNLGWLKIPVKIIMGVIVVDSVISIWTALRNKTNTAQ